MPRVIAELLFDERPQWRLRAQDAEGNAMKTTTSPTVTLDVQDFRRVLRYLEFRDRAAIHDCIDALAALAFARITRKEKR